MFSPASSIVTRHCYGSVKGFFVRTTDPIDAIQGGSCARRNETTVCPSTPTLNGSEGFWQLHRNRVMFYFWLNYLQMVVAEGFAPPLNANQAFVLTVTLRDHTKF